MIRVESWAYLSRYLQQWIVFNGLRNFVQIYWRNGSIGCVIIKLLGNKFNYLLDFKQSNLFLLNKEMIRIKNGLINEELFCILLLFNVHLAKFQYRAIYMWMNNHLFFVLKLLKFKLVGDLFQRKPLPLDDLKKTKSSKIPIQQFLAINIMIIASYISYLKHLNVEKRHYFFVVQV